MLKTRTDLLRLPHNTTLSVLRNITPKSFVPCTFWSPFVTANHFPTSFGQPVVILHFANIVILHFANIVILHFPNRVILHFPNIIILHLVNIVILHFANIDILHFANILAP